MPRIEPRMTANARALRTGATDSERRMWRILSRYRPRFTRQLVVGPYILDLACRRAKLAVEFDGGQHGEAQDYDGKRTEFLETLGWKVIRFWNSDVSDNPEGVAQAILLSVRERVSKQPTPLPLPGLREGRSKGR